MGKSKEKRRPICIICVTILFNFMKYAVLNLVNFPKKPVISYCPASECMLACSQVCMLGVHGSAGGRVSDSEGTYDSECVWLSLGGDVRGRHLRGIHAWEKGVK